ncbi:hypothetical protein ES705_26888 [subsurface metagenome]
MDIRNWGIGQIMQLPDCCFGRRFSVCCAAQSVDAAVVFDISEIAFPETFVLWEVVITNNMTGVVLLLASVRLALGDQIPLNVGTMDVLDPLVPGLGLQGREPRYIVGLGSSNIFHMRNPICARGRRLVMMIESHVERDVHVQVVCEVSSIPTEVPDWLCSV